MNIHLQVQIPSNWLKNMNDGSKTPQNQLSNYQIGKKQTEPAEKPSEPATTTLNRPKYHQTSEKPS